MTYSVRRLSSADLAAMRALNSVFAEAFDAPEDYAEKLPGDAYLQRVLAAESNIVVVAEADGAVIAGLVAYRLDKFEQERSEIYIYDLAVLEVWRRQGVATALIAHLQGIAKGLGAWVIYVQADYVDPPAIALYEKLGRREEVLHFDIDPL